jgi:hypothetical protein
MPSVLLHWGLGLNESAIRPRAHTGGDGAPAWKREGTSWRCARCVRRLRMRPPCAGSASSRHARQRRSEGTEEGAAGSRTVGLGELRKAPRWSGGGKSQRLFVKGRSRDRSSIVECLYPAHSGSLLGRTAAVAPGQRSKVVSGRPTNGHAAEQGNEPDSPQGRQR